MEPNKLLEGVVIPLTWFVSATESASDERLMQSYP